MKITLHIERLVLEGLPLGPGQERQLGAALETELARLLAAGGLADGLRGGGALPYARVGSLVLAHGDAAATLGHKIARALYESIGLDRSKEVSA